MNYLQSNAQKDFHILNRKTPANVEAEQMLLGAIIINSYLLEKVINFLVPEHFFEVIHQRIYSSMRKLHDKNLSINVMTLKSILLDDKLFQEFENERYLIKLTSMATIVIEPGSYAKIIYENFIKRKLIEIGEDIVNSAYDQSITSSISAKIQEAESKLFRVSNDNSISFKEFIAISNSIKDSMKDIDSAIKSDVKITGISTLFTDLDDKLHGFQNSDLIIIAGRPSMGKTAFALNLAFNNCKSLFNKDNNSGTVGFFSLEMSAKQLSTRMISMLSEVNSDDLRSGDIDEEKYNRIKKASVTLSDLPFFVDDTPGITISSIVTRARRLKRTKDLRILFIDYLQLIRTDKNYSDTSRVLQISEITQSLKYLAKELDIPVIALSQLSRSVEKRDNKKPMLSDLRESGSIEQDSDIVMFIHRDEYYLLREEPNGMSTHEYQEWQQKLSQVSNMAEIFIAKNRNGSIGGVKLNYNTKYSAFNNISRVQNSPH